MILLIQSPNRKAQMIKCQVEGCNIAIDNSALSLNARYICPHHTRREQWKALERQPDERKDNSDKDIHFQDHQFDKDLKRGRRPIDTNHIQRQGSEIDDQQEKLDLSEEHLEGIN